MSNKCSEVWHLLLKHSVSFPNTFPAPQPHPSPRLRHTDTVSKCIFQNSEALSFTCSSPQRVRTCRRILLKQPTLTCRGDLPLYFWIASPFSNVNTAAAYRLFLNLWVKETPKDSFAEEKNNPKDVFTPIAAASVSAEEPSECLVTALWAASEEPWNRFRPVPPSERSIWADGRNVSPCRAWNLHNGIRSSHLQIITERAGKWSKICISSFGGFSIITVWIPLFFFLDSRGAASHS